MQDSSPPWNECLVNLQGTLDTLHSPEEYRKHQHKSCNPESVPLCAFPPVIPPLWQVARLRLIEDLLQDNKAVMPEFEALDAAVIRPQMAALSNLLVEELRRWHFLNPLLYVVISLGAKKCQSAKSLVDEAIWKD